MADFALNVRLMVDEVPKNAPAVGGVVHDLAELLNGLTHRDLCQDPACSDSWRLHVEGLDIVVERLTPVESPPAERPHLN